MSCLFVEISMHTIHFPLLIVIALGRPSYRLRSLACHRAGSSRSLICMVLSLSVRVLNYGLPLKYFSDFTFINRLASIVKFKLVAATAHTKNLEAIDLWNKSWGGQYRVIEVLKKMENDQQVSKVILTFKKTWGKLEPK